MAVEHLDADSLRSIPGIHYRLPVRRRYGCSGRARPRDRCATARPFAPDSTSHRPASSRLRTATTAKATRVIRRVGR